MHSGRKTSSLAARGRGPTVKDSRFNALDFTQSVDVILVTFSVLVGVSFTDFFDETKNKLPEDAVTLAFAALVALLLRYIIGSAVHLKHAYRPAPSYEHSSSILLFLKDIFFLLIFGYLAIRISHSEHIHQFWKMSAIFIFVSLVWSLGDPLIRCLFEPQAPTQQPLWKYWAFIDACQLALTLLVYWQLDDPQMAAGELAALYIIFLGVDLRAMLR